MADQKPPPDLYQGAPQIPGTPQGWSVPDNKSQFYMGNTVDAFGNVGGHVRIGGTIIPPAQGGAPPSNYVDAFDPTNPRISVDTGNATMTQIEDLRSLISTPPQIIKPDNTFMVPTAILALIFLL